MALLLFIVLWVTIRALAARDELVATVPAARAVASAALSGNTASMTSSMADLQQHSDAAASLTSDPIWRMAEVLPIVGDNLTAFRQAAAMVDELADTALPPLQELATTVTIDSLSPVDGRYDLASFAAARPLLSKATHALNVATQRASEIDTSDTIEQIGTGIDQLVDTVNLAKTVVGGLDTAAAVIPDMMGEDAPRSYLLMSLNSSELRAGGGTPGSLAVLTADRGSITVSWETVESALGTLDSPVLPLTEAEHTLYGDSLGTSMRNVTQTPEFSRTAELAAALWKQHSGVAVDGVISVDPVALSYLLSATGPLTVDGVYLSDRNAPSILLSDAYSRFLTPTRQEKFVSSVTSQVFEALTDGTANPNRLLGAISRGVNEKRIHVWSADAGEEAQLASTPIAGNVTAAPAGATGRPAEFGLYLNDATGANMGFYLRSDIDISSAVCRTDRQPQFDVTAALTSTAPVDAGVLLPASVTGGGHNGVSAGNIKTNVFIYAPDGATAYAVSVDGVDRAFTTAQQDGHSVVGVAVEVAPQQTDTVTVRFLAPRGTSTAVHLTHTPMAAEVTSSLGGFLDCAEAAR